MGAGAIGSPGTGGAIATWSTLANWLETVASAARGLIDRSSLGLVTNHHLRELDSRIRLRLKESAPSARLRRGVAELDNQNRHPSRICDHCVHKGSAIPNWKADLGKMLLAR